MWCLFFSNVHPNIEKTTTGTIPPLANQTLLKCLRNLLYVSLCFETRLEWTVNIRAVPIPEFPCYEVYIPDLQYLVKSLHKCCPMWSSDRLDTSLWVYVFIFCLTYCCNPHPSPVLLFPSLYSALFVFVYTAIFWYATHLYVFFSSFVHLHTCLYLMKYHTRI